MCLASPRMLLLNTGRVLRVCTRNCAWRASIFELLIGERRCALLAQMEIVGDIHGECTMQSLWYKHAWCTGHDVAGGIVGRYDARAIKRPGTSDLGLVPPIRIERTTNGLGNRCSIQLSYGGVEATILNGR